MIRTKPRKPIPNTFVMNRRTYEIKKGDYILDNGSCLQFCTGDGRTLKRIGWSAFTNVTLTKKLISEFPLHRLQKVTKGYLIYYVF